MALPRPRRTLAACALIAWYGCTWGNAFAGDSGMRTLKQEPAGQETTTNDPSAQLLHSMQCAQPNALVTNGANWGSSASFLTVCTGPHACMENV